MQIIVAILLIALIYMAFQNRKQEKEEFIREEREEESGKYWDKTEQDWTSKREQTQLSERRSTYQQATADELKKQLMVFLYNQYPKLADLDSKSYAKLNDMLGQQVRQMLQEVEKLSKS